MFRKKKIIAIITARKGSKGIKNKNIKNLNGYPLLAYTINYAKKSKLIDRVFVTTDGEKISSISKKFNAETIIRPKKLSNDTSMNDLAVTHAIKHIKKNLNYNFNYVVLLQPTTPLRKKGELDKAIKYAISNKFDTVFSSINYNPFLWRVKNKKMKPYSYNPFKRKIRQKLNDFNETGSYYISKKEVYLKFNNRFGKNVSSYNSDFNSFFEIDTIKDFMYISEILKSSIPKKYNICLPKQ